MAYPRNLFLNIARDEQGRIWGVARLCLADGSCVCVESRIYRELAKNGDFVAGDEDDDESPKNRALDEALDKLCKITQNKAIMRAVPLPARIALKLVCKARNLYKIKKAAEEDGDDELQEDAAGALSRMKNSRNEIARRAVHAQRLWQ